MAALSLIVLRCVDLEVSRSFYAALGLCFEKEKHGNGPIHYSCQLGDLVLELYPGKPVSVSARTVGGATMHGFHVDSLEAVLANLQMQRSEIIHSPSDSPWGRRAIVLDPDGRAVELTQSQQCVS